MKRILLSLCFFVMFHEKASAQDGAPARQDRLKPATSFYDVGDWGEDYYQVIKDYLISAEKDFLFTSRFWVMPSFRKEYFVATVREGEEFFLIHRTPEKEIWTDGNFPKAEGSENYIPDIVEIKRNISRKDARMLNLLIEVAVVGAIFDQEIRSDKDEITVSAGFDGTNYFFSTSVVYPAKTATVWSPRPGSKTGELVEVLEEVIEKMKNGESGPVEFTPEFVAKIEELTNKFKDDL